MVRLGLCAGLVLALGAACSVEAADAPKDSSTKKSTATTKTKKSADTSKLAKATFGGGCFWCMEAVFERVVGVKDVVSGYAGGTTKKPYYDLVCTGTTGHAEVVQITYDPEVVTFEQLLDIFWRAHDPTTLNRQGPDFGTQYRSIVLFHDEAQRKATLKSYEELTNAQVFGAPIVTQLEPLRVFYPAEKHHQNYYRKNKNAAYCQRTIAPKLIHLKQELQQLQQRDAQRKAQP
jgi:peptide-methionine (S)-S-oxide reductase